MVVEISFIHINKTQELGELLGTHVKAWCSHLSSPPVR